MRLPRSIKVGHIRYRITEASQRSGNYGETFEEKQEIQIRPGQADDVLADTLLHEVLHAIWFQTPLVKMFDNDGEAVIQALAPGIIHVLRENPALAAIVLGDEDG